MPTPTTMGVVETSLGKMVMEIDSAITFAMINKLFGGDGNCRERHELTDLETQVMGDIINVTLGSFKEAWKKITDISPKLLNIETNPQFVHAAPPYEMTVVITLAAKINDVEGMINICFPYPALKPILKNLNTKTQYGINKAEGSPPETNLDKVKIPITVKLGDKMLSLENAKNIVEGTIIELDKLTVEPLDVYAGDVLIGKGEAVVIDEKFGIRIVEVYSENTEKTNA
ncbi:hypothetical protein AGMMS50293_23150 [Spirochaetia bacterium]|nr:hypothetical protein AGMMS50293_23150 [Spirochaetia bacterium]